MSLILKKKKINFNSKSLKIKTLITLQKKLNFSKYLIVNNLNNYNLESLKLDLNLNAKLINTAQSRVLKFPFSGITKIIFYSNLIDLNEKLKTIFNFPNFYKIIGVKFNTKFFSIKKVQNYALTNSLKKDFFSKKEILNLKNSNFFFLRRFCFLIFNFLKIASFSKK